MYCFMSNFHCYRCSDCGLNWPYLELYRECPKCRTPNTHFSDVNASSVLGEDEAQSLSRKFNFEYYYEFEHIPRPPDPEDEARLAEAIERTKNRHKDDQKNKDTFDHLIEGQFDDEAKFRIKELEGIMRGREHYRLTTTGDELSEEQ